MEIEDLTIKSALGHPEAHIRAQALILVKQMRDYDEKKSREQRVKYEEKEHERTKK